MTRYLLDTNILSALMRDPRGRILDRIQAVGEGNVYTSVIVAAELRFGAEKRKSASLALKVEHVLGLMFIAPLAPPIDRTYAHLRNELEARGEPISVNDLLIACQARQDRSIVVTANVREFGRVADLQVENWLKD